MKTPQIWYAIERWWVIEFVIMLYKNVVIGANASLPLSLSSSIFSTSVGNGNENGCHRPLRRTTRCCDRNENKGGGFGPNSRRNRDKATGDLEPPPRRPRRSTLQQSRNESSQALTLNSRIQGKPERLPYGLQFEERLEAVRRSAVDQKKDEGKKEHGAIDYDAPIEAENVGLWTRIGVGVAVLVFGLVFTLGDFLPSGSPNKEATVVKNVLPQEEKAKLQKRLQQYEATLSISPEEPAALEGAALTLTELGDYSRAASLLNGLAKKKPNDPNVFRLLGEVKYGLGDYEGSAAAYRSSAMVSQTMDFEVLRGLTNALLAARKPDEAVKTLLASRESENQKDVQANSKAGDSARDTEFHWDPIQVDLLLGKAYSDWGHISDAVSVYDQLISSHPDDFRGYLAKGIILRENGKFGDAERMFIQARFFAPSSAKALVDRYSRP